MNPRQLIVALQLLTRLPVGDPAHDESWTSGAVGWFAVVGAVVGGVAASVFWAASLAFPPAAAAVLSVGVGVALTGGLHLDGLAHTADGFFGGHDPDDRLRIMADKVLGAYGVVGIVLALLLRVTLLAALDPVQGAAALVVTGAISRGVLGVAILNTVPAARGAVGTVLDDVRGRPAWAALVSATVIALGLLRLPGATMVLAGLGIAIIVRTMAVRRIGGTTRDVMDAMIMSADVAALMVAVGLGATAVGS